MSIDLAKLDELISQPENMMRTLIHIALTCKVPLGNFAQSKDFGQLPVKEQQKYAIKYISDITCEYAIQTFQEVKDSTQRFANMKDINDMIQQLGITKFAELLDPTNIIKPDQSWTVAVASMFKLQSPQTVPSNAVFAMPGSSANHVNPPYESFPPAYPAQPVHQAPPRFSMMSGSLPTGPFKDVMPTCCTNQMPFMAQNTTASTVPTATLPRATASNTTPYITKRTASKAIASRLLSAYKAKKATDATDSKPQQFDPMTITWQSVLEATDEQYLSKERRVAKFQGVTFNNKVQTCLKLFNVPNDGRQKEKLITLLENIALVFEPHNV